MRFAVNALSVVPDETGGGETYLRELLRALAEPSGGAKHEVLVYCSRNGATLFEERGAVRLRVIDLDNRSRVRRLLHEHLRLASALQRDGVDALYAPGNALPLRVPCPAVLGIQSLHSFQVPEEMSRFRVAYFRRMVPRSARRAQRVLCVSHDIRATLLRAAPDVDPDTVRVVHEGAPTDVARVDDPERLATVCADHGVEPGRFVLFVSSLNPFKRPERAVQAVAKLRDGGAGTWPLLLAGRASAEHTARVVAAARACGAEDLVHVLGTVGRDDLAALYSAARAFVYPSTVETFGLPPLEAMACDCPVVAADRTSIPEVVGDAGLLVDPDDVDALAAALRRALEDEDLRADLVRRGRARLGVFTWEAAAQGTVALLEEAAKE